MTEPQGEPRRLDSWKAIAAHLNRDERTVRRWEQELGLPIRRLPGGRGRSVFAYVEELDAWLKRGEPDPKAPFADSSQALAPGPVSSRGIASRIVGIVAATAVIVVLATAWAWARRSPVDGLRLSTTQHGVRALAADGSEVWSYQFPTEYGWSLPSFDMVEPSRVMAGGHPAVYVATSFKVRRADEQAASGQLFEFSPRGDIVRTFAFTDTVTIGGKAYGPPWAITSFAVSDSGGARRIVISAHHYIWGASIVATLDDQFRRTGTMVHDGWIEAVRWVAADRVLATGFSNADDAGTALLLAADSIDKPLRAYLFGRSELNRITHSRFNRAVPQLLDRGYLIRTMEVLSQDATPVADVIYEFTPTLDIVRASYSDRYREAMRGLGHDVGAAKPPAPRVWTAAGGWTTLANVP